MELISITSMLECSEFGKRRAASANLSVLLNLQVRKEYGKCLRTHCCSGKSVDSSIGSGKGTASRAPGRYSTGSQVKLHFSLL